MCLFKYTFLFSTSLLGIFFASSSNAKLIYRQAYKVCEIDEVAFWDGSNAQCCDGNIFKALETQNYQCCSTPNVVSTVLGNPYLKACCPPGQTPYTTSTPSNPETSTLSWCCDGDASEVAGRSGFFKCCGKGEKAFWDGYNEQCCVNPQPVYSWVNVYRCCAEGDTGYAVNGSQGGCCSPGTIPMPLAGAPGSSMCCPPDSSGPSNTDGCCSSGTVPTPLYGKETSAKCCQAGETVAYKTPTGSTLVCTKSIAGINNYGQPYVW